MDNIKRKFWTRDETLLFLKCYAARKNEFLKSRKRKFAYSNVLKDMLAKGFTDMSISTKGLEGKMRTLLHAYKSAKSNNCGTDAAPCRAPFMEELDKIFGPANAVCNNHTLNLGRIQRTALPEKGVTVKLDWKNYSSVSKRRHAKSFVDPNPKQHSSLINESLDESDIDQETASCSSSKYTSRAASDIDLETPLCASSKHSSREPSDVDMKTPLCFSPKHPSRSISDIDLEASSCTSSHLATKKSVKERFYAKKLKIYEKFLKNLKELIAKKLDEL